jgi:3'(2'), 5'-bisphosphate nucleotidase
VTTMSAAWMEPSFLSAVCETALRAGRAAMDIYEAGFDVAYKADSSPVTAADLASEAIILEGLRALCPGIAIVAEETAAAGDLPDTGERFFLVDPLDGTKEFLSRNGEFTVNIALVESAVPVFGVIYAPAMGKLYGTSAAGAFEADAPVGAAAFNMLRPKAIRTSAPSRQGLTGVVSRSHMCEDTKRFVETRGIARTRTIGSSLKFCLVASGQADVYPRFGPTWEWDTAAGHAILNAAGGCVTGIDGSPFLYGKRSERFLNPGFVAWASPGMTWK